MALPFFTGNSGVSFTVFNCGCSRQRKRNGRTDKYQKTRGGKSGEPEAKKIKETTYMKKQCIAMLLAGGQGSRLHALTRSDAKPNLSFGGKYRLIDFALSNCSNSGIDTVGVLTQYRPLELNRYIGSGQPWDLDISDGGVCILPPYRTDGENGRWFSGTADAVYQNMGFIGLYDPGHVLVLSADHIYKMDYSKLLREHIRLGADCTVAVRRVEPAEASRFGIVCLDADGRICGFEEKPRHPKSDLASMGIYVFRWEKLREYLIRDETDPDSENDFGKNVLPAMLRGGASLQAYRFGGYWRDVGTIGSFWDANMDMLSPGTIGLFDPAWPIRTRSPILPPHFTGRNASISRSIVSEGCTVLGAVCSSVLSTGTVVEEGARVEYSILMPGSRVCAGALVRYAIVGEGTVIGEGALVGSPPDGSGGWSTATCGPGLTVGAGAVVPAGAMLSDSVGEVCPA